MRADDDRRTLARAATGTAFARAALAGNPSDGYGGAVLAVCLRDAAATVELTPVPGPPALRVEPGAAAALVAAAAARHAAATGVATSGLHATVRTTIPREVGLAGSSAIVIATLRALDALLGTAIDREELPLVALAAETDLGIAAGLQDRVAQAYGGLTAMSFGDGTFAARAVDPALLPPLFVAWVPGSAAPSGTYHAALRERWTAGDPEVRSAMARLAQAARDATAAVEREDPPALAAAMDASYDLRAALGPLDPRHVALVRTAREVGLCANYAGSGGAIVGIVTDRDRLDALGARLAPAGAHVRTVATR